MELREQEAYRGRSLPSGALGALSLFGDMLLASPTNVTGLRDAGDIERRHFLDSLSLLDIPDMVDAGSVVDVGSGGGLPAVVLAIARPRLRVTAVESVTKKCRFIEEAAGRLGLDNVEVVCARAEDYGRESGRERHDLAVARAVAALPVLTELCVPLLRLQGLFIAMKGSISNQERMEAEQALAILGGGGLEERKIVPFPGAENRFFYVCRKQSATPARYPRRTGVPAKRPLGSRREARG